MKIPFIDYEFTISRKVYFCFFSMILYLIVAMPDTNKFIGKYLTRERVRELNNDSINRLFKLFDVNK